MAQHEQNAHSSGEDRFDERGGDGADGASDEGGAIVERHDAHAGRQAGLQFDDLGLEPARHLQGILTMAHEHDAAGRLRAVFFEDATAGLAAQRHAGDAAQRDGRAVGGGKRNVFEVADNALGLEAGVGLAGPGPEPADAADDELRPTLLDDIAAGGRIGPADRVRNLGRRNAALAQLARIEFDLVLRRRPTDAGDLRDAGHSAQLRPNVPILDRPQPARVQPAALDRVPVDLPGRGGIGR